MYEHQYLYKTLDNPIRILFWSLDDFLVFAVPLFLSLCFGSLLFLLAGFILKPFYSRLKKRFPNGSLKHKIYWSVPMSCLKHMGKIKNLPPSYYRELLL